MGQDNGEDICKKGATKKLEVNKKELVGLLTKGLEETAFEREKEGQMGDTNLGLIVNGLKPPNNNKNQVDTKPKYHYKGCRSKVLSPLKAQTQKQEKDMINMVAYGEVDTERKDNGKAKLIEKEYNNQGM